MFLYQLPALWLTGFLTWWDVPSLSSYAIQVLSGLRFVGFPSFLLTVAVGHGRPEAACKSWVPDIASCQPSIFLLVTQFSYPTWYSWPPLYLLVKQHTKLKMTSGKIYFQFKGTTSVFPGGTIPPLSTKDSRPLNTKLRGWKATMSPAGDLE